MVRFSIFYGVSYEMQVCLAMLCTHKFFKRKKEKKESRHLKWKVSKKQVFRIKYYPNCQRERTCEVWDIFQSETVWVEILSETWKAWTCFFEYLELIFASFFLFIFFEFPINPCFEIGYYSGIVLSNVIVI